jgi:hypothetical protein
MIGGRGSFSLPPPLQPGLPGLPKSGRFGLSGGFGLLGRPGRPKSGFPGGVNTGLGGFWIGGRTTGRL